MRSVACLFFACVTLTTQSFAAPVTLSDGLYGAFAPSSSVILAPDQDGIFNFTTVDIAEPVLVSFDRSSWESDIYLLATGDINIFGALDTGPGRLHMYTPGAVTIDGKIYGDTIFLSAEEFHAINNPNGSPDEHLYGGIYTTIQPDGMLELSAGNTVAGTSSSFLSGAIGFQDYSGVILSTQVAELNYSSSFILQSPSGGIFPTPLPPAIWLLLSAIAVTGLFGRNKNRQTQ